VTRDQMEQIEELQQVLYAEAEVLDGRRFDEWLQMLTDDIVYEAPVRLTRERGQEPDFSEGMYHFQDDRRTLQLRVDRLHTDFAWAEDPPSRTRRMISNVRVRPGGTGEGLEVRSYILLYKSRGAEPSVDLISAERRDLWRRVEGVWKLARRFVLFDQSTLGVASLTNFL
jgi:ethylbenzene dioxygenase beta subunit